MVEITDEIVWRATQKATHLKVYCFSRCKSFSGALAKKKNITVVMSACPSVLSNSTTTRRIQMKFGIGEFFENISRKV